ncbi:MAG: 4'-phosphopantetheinyl transferase superfamily protein [Saprospiraceae bacterium]
MPLLDYYSIQEAESYIGIWELNEDIDFFKSRLDLFPSELEEISTLKQRKLLEWYCSRYLLHLMSNRQIRGACLKDEHGKPFLENSSYFISMSHSHDRIAVIASPFKVGIDIQFIVPKIERIAPRFISESEMNSIPNTDKILFYHLYWGAKESLFKIYGRKELDFREHIKIEPISTTTGIVTFGGQVYKNDEQIQCTIKGCIAGDFVWVYAWEKK